jgi:hypothetical protein
MRLARFTSGQGGEVAHEKIMALRDWRDRIGQSRKAGGVSSGDLALDICFGNPPLLRENSRTYLSLGLKQTPRPTTGMNHSD